MAYIKHKSTTITGNVPTTSDLRPAELAINSTDGKIFLEKNGSTVEEAFVTSGRVTGSLHIASKNNTQDVVNVMSGSKEVFVVNEQGVASVGTFTTLPTAVEGGLVRDNNGDFYLGV